jgi:hypothetical protein
MDKTKNIISVSIIVLFIIIIIEVIFYGIKLTQKPAPIVEEKPTKTESLPKIEKIRKYNIVYGIVLKDLLLSPNGQYVGVSFEKDKKEYVQINDKIYGPYDRVYVPIFSNDGLKYGWWFKKDNKYYVQINDRTYGPYNWAPDLIFSDDSSKYGWWFVKDDKNYIQINDKIYGPYDTFHGPIIFSNDSSKYGWGLGKDNKYYIKINDKIYGPYDKATFTFTKDNKAYIAYISGNELVIEEVE